MSTNTTRASLLKPDGEENVNHLTQLNNNWDQVDEHLGYLVCTSSTRPTGTDRFTGRCIWETDTKNRYIWTGTEWYLLNKLFVRKTASQTVNNSSALTPDNHISFGLDVGTWIVEAYYSVIGPASGDFKTSWSFSGTISTSRRFADGQSNSGTDANSTAINRNAETAFGTSLGWGLDSVINTGIFEKHMVVVTASGTFQMNWGQQTPIATNTTVQAGSYATAQRVA